MIALNSEDDTLVAWRQRPRGDHEARVAFLGNSIQYYNDCPRFLANLSNGAISHQDSCFRGGATLATLWEKGNGMGRTFATKNAELIAMKEEDGNEKNYLVGAVGSPVVVYDVGSPTVIDLLRCDDVEDEELLFADSGVDERRSTTSPTRWDFVVMNDHTQGPARASSRKANEKVLLEKYLPLIAKNHATPIIIETHAYRYPGINNSADLGNVYEFTKSVREGVQSYVEALQSKLPQSIRPRLAPVGTAFLHVHDDNHEVWEGLFDSHDHFHPSPSGTFLQGCVLHWTMFGSPPPLSRTEDEIKDLWKDARVMHDIRNGDKGTPLPTLNVVEYLWNVAAKICEPIS